MQACSSSINRQHRSTTLKIIRITLHRTTHSSKKWWIVRNILSSMQSNMAISSKEDMSILHSTISSKVLHSIRLSTTKQRRDSPPSGSRDFSISIKNLRLSLKSMRYWTSRVHFWLTSFWQWIVRRSGLLLKRSTTHWFNVWMRWRSKMQWFCRKCKITSNRTSRSKTEHRSSSRQGECGSIAIMSCLNSMNLYPITTQNCRAAQWPITIWTKTKG